MRASCGHRESWRAAAIGELQFVRTWRPAWGWCRGLFDFQATKKDRGKRIDTEITEDAESAEKRAKRDGDSARGEREDEEVAFAGMRRQGAAVRKWRNQEAEAVKDGMGCGCETGTSCPMTQ